MKAILLNLIFILLFISCSEKQDIDKQKVFDLECKIVEINDLANKTEGLLITLKSTKASQDTIESVEKKLQTIKFRLDSLLSKTIENNYDSTENNLIDEFNLNNPTIEQQKFLLLFYSYKILGRDNFSYGCGFGDLVKLPNNDSLLKEYFEQNRIANKNYNHYIESKINAPRKKAYPNLTSKHYLALELVSEKFIKKQFSKELTDRAHAITQKDSTLNSLYKKKKDAFLMRTKPQPHILVQ